MAERISNPTPSDVLCKIRGFVRSLLEDLANGRTPSVALDRYRSYCSDPSANCTCCSDLPCGKEIILLDKECHAYRLDVLLRVLLIIQQLLQENKHGSKRDIYYMQPSVFKGACWKRVNLYISELRNIRRCLHLLCIYSFFSVSEHHAFGKSLLVMGWLKFTEGGREVYCIRNPNAAYSIPVCVEEVEGVVSVARFILVVEKETVFQRLSNDRFCDRNRCIVITGRGYPDVPTRRFLCHLVKQLQLPVFCLVDSDPYGFDILTTYRFGSMQMAYDAKLMRVPGIRWLGVFPSEFEKYCLPDRCLLHLTPEDKKKVQAMMLRCYLHREAPEWRSELEIMLQKGVKFEIEALSVSSLSFLSEEYIPAKIQHGAHI